MKDQKHKKKQQTNDAICKTKGQKPKCKLKGKRSKAKVSKQKRKKKGGDHPGLP